MDDIGNFIEKALAQFLASQHGIKERFNLNLSSEAVKHFIESSYYASMIPDENRWPCVCLMCYKKENEPSFYMLKSQEAISADNIAKISHAVADDSHICCISDNGRLIIGGIQITRLYDSRELGYSSFRTPNPLKLFIRCPGHIEVSTGGIALVYEAGKISEESLLPYSRIMDELAAAVSQKMQPDTRGKVEALEDIFNDIAKAIMRLGHGGLLLITDEPQNAYFSSYRQVDSSLLRQPLIRYWESVADLLAAVGGVANLLASSDAIGNSHSLIVAANTEMLEECIRAVAHLAGMDGAIALNYECNVVAFNAIIAKLEDDPKDYCFVDTGDNKMNYKDVVRNRGSRHQSALSFVMRVPKSFAFVISQDGSVSAFHNLGNKRIRCAPGMRVLE